MRNKEEISKGLVPSEARNEFARVFKELTRDHRAWDVWKDFITMYACAISNTVDKSHFDEREAMYMRCIEKYKKGEQALFPELIAYLVAAIDENQDQDFLGSIFMELGLGSTSKGQFFTPYDICKAMAGVTLGDDLVDRIEEKGVISINDSSCGAGATLIAAIQEAKRKLEGTGYNYQERLMIIGQDVDEIVALMCYIQISLLGMPGFVKVDNTLTNPICGGDSKENYWYTPIYMFGRWRYLRKKEAI